MKRRILLSNLFLRKPFTRDLSETRKDFVSFWIWSVQNLLNSSNPKRIGPKIFGAKRLKRNISLGALLSGLSGSFFFSSALASTLDQVRQRDMLNCSGNRGLPGFSLPDANGKWTGLDVAYCRALAAAILGSAEKVRFLPLSAKERFTALQSGEIDVLVRNTTWSLTYETNLGLMFGPVNYYDGQGFLVRKKLHIHSIEELAGASVCVQQGTTTELNLSDYFRSRNLTVEPVVFETEEGTRQAYESGRCDAYTTDGSSLAGTRLSLKNSDEHEILPEFISKEPLASVVRKGDDAWFDIVRWTHYAMVTAEELGVTSKNVEEMLKSSHPEIQRLLGVTGEIGTSLGLSKDWAYRIIKQVGNYGEVFSQNLGEESKFKLARGLNDLWNRGGLQYAPPIR